MLLSSSAAYAEQKKKQFVPIASGSKQKRQFWFFLTLSLLLLPTAPKKEEPILHLSPVAAFKFDAVDARWQNKTRSNFASCCYLQRQKRVIFLLAIPLPNKRKVGCFAPRTSNFASFLRRQIKKSKGPRASLTHNDTGYFIISKLSKDCSLYDLAWVCDGICVGHQSFPKGGLVCRICTSHLGCKTGGTKFGNFHVFLVLQPKLQKWFPLTIAHVVERN